MEGIPGFSLSVWGCAAVLGLIAEREGEAGGERLNENEQRHYAKISVSMCL